MQASNKDTVTFSGIAKIEAALFNNFTAELTVYCDAVHCAVRYQKLPILRLSIKRVFGEIVVDDEYSHHIPYLKAIPAFRDFIDTRLRHFACSSPHNVIIDGIREYLRELRDYSDVKGLVRQAKSAVNLIRPDHRDAERKARGVLKALERTPGCDIGFEIEN